MPPEEEKVASKGDETPDPRDEELAKLKASVDTLQRKNEEYEQLLTDPKYLEYLTGGSDGTQADRDRERVEAAAAREDVDLEALSNKQLVEYIRKVLRTEISTAVEPIKKQTETDRRQAQIDRALSQVREAAAKHDDYYDFREPMLQLAKLHPTLSAEEIYILAKGSKGEKPKKPSKPSLPPTGGAKTSAKTPEGFQAKFAQAWQAAGFGE